MQKGYIRAINNDEDLWVHRHDLHPLRERSPYFTDYFIPYELSNRDILLVNTLTGAIDYIHGLTPEQISQRIKQTNNKSYADLRKYLHARGYIFNSKREEADIRKKIVKRFTETNSTFDCYLYPTTACNFACPYCFSKDIEGEGNRIEKRDLERCFSFIAKHARLARIPSNRVRIVLFGGEPLLPNLYRNIEYILKTAAENGWIVAIVTNGYTIDQYLPLLKKYRSSIQYIQITLDGPERVHNRRRMLKGNKKRGTFRNIVGNIELLARHKFQCVVRVNVDDDNIRHIDKLRTYASRRGWGRNNHIQFALSPVLDHELPNFFTLSTKEHLKLVDKRNGPTGEVPIIALLKNAMESHLGGTTQQPKPKIHVCPPASLSALAFFVDSLIYPCISTVGKKKHAIGSFSPKGKLFVERSAAWRDRSIERIPKCKKCIMAFFCGGTCPVKSIEVRKDINKPICSGPASIEGVLMAYLDMNRKKILEKLKSLEPDISVE